MIEPKALRVMTMFPAPTLTELQPSSPVGGAVFVVVDVVDLARHAARVRGHDLDARRAVADRFVENGRAQHAPERPLASDSAGRDPTRQSDVERGAGLALAPRRLEDEDQEPLVGVRNGHLRRVPSGTGDVVRPVLEEVVDMAALREGRRHLRERLRGQHDHGDGGGEDDVRQSGRTSRQSDPSDDRCEILSRS